MLLCEYGGFKGSLGVWDSVVGVGLYVYTISLGDFDTTTYTIAPCNTTIWSIHFYAQFMLAASVHAGGNTNTKLTSPKNALLV